MSNGYGREGIKVGMCNTARCAPCTWAPLWWQVCLGRYNKCSTFTFNPLSHWDMFCQPIVSKHSRKHNSLTPAIGLASFSLYIPPDVWQKGNALFTPDGRCHGQKVQQVYWCSVKHFTRLTWKLQLNYSNPTTIKHTVYRRFRTSFYLLTPDVSPNENFRCEAEMSMNCMFNCGWIRVI